MGLKESVCADLGVSKMHGTWHSEPRLRPWQGTEGATRHPPADMLYAVDPLGVATISPSAYTSVTNLHKQ